MTPILVGMIFGLICALFVTQAKVTNDAIQAAFNTLGWTTVTWIGGLLGVGILHFLGIA